MPPFVRETAFVDQKSGCAVYYWHGMNELKKYSTMFPWHAYWQIGWIVDYLIAEAGLRSDSNISFPYGYMTPKVGPHVTYGFAPGNIYGKKADLLFRPVTPIISLRDHPNLSKVLTHTSNANVESNPPEMPTTALLAAVCTRR